ncbi:low activity glyoxalase ElbB [uncultured Gammaproteobacteria bacterium]
MAHDPIRIGVVLSGCGVYDGAEVQEAVLTLLAINKLGAEAVCYAPDIAQNHVINHLTGQEMPEQRNVLVESARIARGKIADLAAFKVAEIDALIFPGGFGAAKNLSSFAFEGAGCQINPDVAKAVRATADAGKPIGALCIAPVILARLLGDVELTIGSDPGTGEAIEAMGARHTISARDEVVVDRKARVVTSPCYMLDSTIAQIAAGAENTVRTLLELARVG